MYTPSIIAVLALAVSNVYAAKDCICEEDVYKVADNYGLLFSNYTNEFAARVVTPDYHVQTDSVSWLANNGTNCPFTLGKWTYTNVTELQLAQSTQPNIPWVNTNVFWNCERIFVRWRSELENQQVQGISIILPERNPNNDTEVPWLIKTVFAEFNTGAWIANFDIPVGTSPCKTGKASAFE
ncbi:hypothetical protein LTR37_020025 [Vermiconidia calcicola]|uniref:Uncharacterized protein n=1 Tax=Vermiconidia calcicola TaxID=1690605 RepID=A0ACC3MFH6_9PEZI|nr:hypothetical protein LTR37_020025 [Vermiconidia calcicola]